jgi:outer membrane protein OmpA-like peptidoglycan-associated protein
MHDSNASLTKKLHDRAIEVIKYGKKTTVIIPTDRYFLFNSAELNEANYPALYNLKEFIQQQHTPMIYVAAFTDNVGSREHKNKLSDAQAQTILSFLWANGIPAKRLDATGFGDQFPIASNEFIHASAYNRRIEIQWLERSCGMRCALLGHTK